MSTSRLFSLFVALALVVVVVTAINAAGVPSKVVSDTRAALDQHARYVDLAAASANVAEKARFEYRRGEWKAGIAAARANAALGQHDRHASRSLPDSRTCVLCGGQ